jgi:hypothetical protein
MLNDRVSLYWIVIVYMYVCLISELKLDINRLNTLRADTFSMQEKKERTM